jgi:hypothetical protein
MNRHEETKIVCENGLYNSLVINTSMDIDNVHVYLYSIDRPDLVPIFK